MKTELVQRIRYPGGYWKVLPVTSQCKAGDKSLMTMDWKVKGKHSIETVIRDYLLEESGCEEKQKVRALKDISSQRRVGSVRQKWPEHRHRRWRGRDGRCRRERAGGQEALRSRAQRQRYACSEGETHSSLGTGDRMELHVISYTVFLSIRTGRWRRAHLKRLFFQVAKARFKQLLRRVRYRLPWWLRW